jgi:hypothetical protein
MDQPQIRLDALEQQMHSMNRRLHWWRGLACGAVVLAVLTWALPTVIAQDEASERGRRRLAQRVAALEQLLKHFSREGNEITITGANLHIVNGLGQTACGTEEEPIPDCPNRLGNLIVGYNEPRQPGEGETIRTGSHNVVVGIAHNFSRFGGLVVGNFNTISGDFASISGGEFNTASGDFASVSGGVFNTASGLLAAVSGGNNNTASGNIASVSGGLNNMASGSNSSVSGGELNIASGFTTAVSGGRANTATGLVASVSGGGSNTASGDFSSVSGGGFNAVDEEGVGNTAVGVNSTVNGGSGNTASGNFSAVGGGRSRMAEGQFDWVAGSLVEDQ